MSIKVNKDEQLNPSSMQLKSGCLAKRAVLWLLIIALLTLTLPIGVSVLRYPVPNTWRKIHHGSNLEFVTSTMSNSLTGQLIFGSNDNYSFHSVATVYYHGNFFFKRSLLVKYTTGQEVSDVKNGWNIWGSKLIIPNNFKTNGFLSYMELEPSKTEKSVVFW